MRIALFIFLHLCVVMKSYSQVTVDFSATNTKNCGFLQTQFTNLSKGPVAKVEWSFGTGPNSLISNPIKIYSNPGKYEVCLTATDTAGIKTTTCKKDFIEVYQNFQPDFVALDSSICAGFDASFQDRTISPNGAIVSWTWELGGSTGSVSSQSNSVVKSIYAQPGDYIISLSTRDDKGCTGTISKKVLKVSELPKVAVDFGTGFICGVAGDIKITNKSPNIQGFIYEWDFGNGKAFSGYDPGFVQYLGEGIYDVKLKIVNKTNNCADSARYLGAVSVENISKFQVDKTETCANAVVNFSSTAIIKGESQIWEFGDGTQANGINTSHTYADSGCFLIRHIVDYKGCRSVSVSPTCLKINELPKVDYVLDKLKDCKFPFVVNATNLSQGAISYEWQQNGHFFSSDTNPIISINAEGNYSIRLLARTSKGCTAIRDRETIIAYKLNPRMAVASSSSCVPATITLNQSNESRDPITSIQWNIFTPTRKNGSGNNFTISIADTGVFDAKLVLQNALGCTDSIYLPRVIAIGDTPIVGIKGPDTLCFDTPLSVRDSSSRYATSFEWKVLPGGSASTEKNAILKYDKVDVFTVYHKAYHHGCPGKEDSLKVFIKGTKADFTYETECADPLLKKLVDKSTAADTVQWDIYIRDSLVSSVKERNTTFKFPESGNYKVRQTTINVNSGCLAHTKEDQVKVRVIKADYETAAREGCAPYLFSINDKSKDAVLYNYEFKDADVPTQTISSPGFTFRKGGTFKGQMIVTDELGCRDTASIDSVLIHQVISDFNYIDKKFCNDSVMTYLNKSIAINDSIIGGEWAFGETITNQYDSILIRMDKSKVHALRLKVKSKFNCTHEKNVPITINELTATITADTLSCTVEKLRFNHQVKGTFSDITWSFGDGGVSSELAPTHNFTKNGSYHIGIDVIDKEFGCRLIVDSIHTIKIAQPNADFDFQASAINCKPYNTSFKNASENTTRYIWDFGDATPNSLNKDPSHLYLSNGLYSIKLIAYSTENCRDTIRKDSIIRVEGPVITKDNTADKIYCAPILLNFNTRISNFKTAYIEWGDDSQEILAATEITQSLSHIYQKDGIFKPVVVAVDSNECQDFAFLDTIEIHQIDVNVQSIDKTVCSENLPVRLRDSIYSSIATIQKSFRVFSKDTNLILPAVPTEVIMRKRGVYSLEYIASNLHCTDTLKVKDAFTVFPKPEVDIRIDTASLCAQDNLAIQSIHKYGDSVGVFKWILNNEPVNDRNNFTINLQEGKKELILYTQDENQCKDTANILFEVKGAVFFNLDEDQTICAETKFNLQAAISNFVPNTLYKWETKDSLLCLNCTDQLIRPSNTKSYRFSSIHPSGCIIQDSIKVTTFRNSIPVPVMTKDTSICAGDFIQLEVQTLNDVFLYQWDSSVTGLSCYQFCKNPIAQPFKTSQYHVTVSNIDGCVREDSVKITVRSKPIFDLGKDHTVCRGDTLAINAGTVQSVKWTGASSLSCTNCSTPVLRPISPISVYAIDAIKDGCKVSDSIVIKILNGDILQSNDTTICTGSAVVLQSRYTNVTWSPSTFLANAATLNPISTPTNSIKYLASYTDDLCTVTDSFKINVLAKTEITGRDWTLCPNEIITLTANGQATDFIWTGPNILKNGNSNSIEVFAKEAASYQVIAKNTTCAPDTAWFNIKLIDFINLKDTLIYNVAPGLPFQLNRTFANDKKYIFEWKPATALTCNNCPAPIFQGETNTSYTMSITDPATGCMLDQLVQVTINSSCNAADFYKVPNIFTPNNDGINDVLQIIPKSSDQIRSFKIFDRQGVLVFQSFDISIGWNGTFRNKPSPAGVYLYMVEGTCPATNKNIILKGDVTLIR